MIGNKIDIRDSLEESDRVDQSQVKKWCEGYWFDIYFTIQSSKDNTYGHIETSAKDGSSVEAAMIVSHTKNDFKPSLIYNINITVVSFMN